MTVGQAGSLLNALIDRVRACASIGGDGVPPAAILWTDPKSQWQSVLDPLRAAMPELLVLGPYNPGRRTGPAIWLRCVVDGTLAPLDWPSGVTPVLYLPEVSHGQLLEGENCSNDLKPLVELLYRGASWLHPNGRDWTPLAFLTSKGSLGLDVSQDAAAALLRALPTLMDQPAARLQGQHWDSADFDALLTPDLMRMVLRWMNDPDAERAAMPAEAWGAFAALCSRRLQFSPEKDGVLTAGRRLGQASGEWHQVWARFEESASRYPNIVDLLSRAAPDRLSFEGPERWPSVNTSAEDTVRDALKSLATMTHEAACALVVGLEHDHASRRRWVWRSLGLAPMAVILEPLARLAEGARHVLGGSQPMEFAERYTERWPVYAAAWEAVALAGPADQGLVKEAVRALLAPWAEASALAFQTTVQKVGLPRAGGGSAIILEAGDCLFFVDGLRYDVGQRLAEKLRGSGCEVDVTFRWAPLPTITPTGKPAVTPIAGEITAGPLTASFEPTTRSGRPADVGALRSEMARAGFQVIGGEEVARPVGDEPRGWCETTEIDRTGHDEGENLPFQMDHQLGILAARVRALLDAGWSRVRIVTDHGWLWMPGGLPKVELPRYLTESRWGRCAVIAGASQVDVPTVPWYWNPNERVAVAPGIGCFVAGIGYAHGGVTVEECVVPDIVVRKAASAAAPRIVSASWRGMRCILEVAPAGVPATADLRAESPHGISVAQTPKAVDPDGSASLLLKDDRYEDTELFVVLLDESGAVVSQHTTRVGGSF